MLGSRCGDVHSLFPDDSHCSVNRGPYWADAWNATHRGCPRNVLCWRPGNLILVSFILFLRGPCTSRRTKFCKDVLETFNYRACAKHTPWTCEASRGAGPAEWFRCAPWLLAPLRFPGVISHVRRHQALGLGCPWWVPPWPLQRPSAKFILNEWI